MNSGFGKYFTIPYTAILIFAACLVLHYGYHESFLVLNGWYFDVLDQPVFFLTHGGDGLFTMALLLLALNKRHFHIFLLILLSVMLSGIITQIMKQVFFIDFMRPHGYFKLMHKFHTVNNYIFEHRSFPSGHSATITSVFTMFALFIKESKPLKYFLCVLAITVLCYTRVYLGVHFMGDIIVGSFIGFLASLFIRRHFTDKTMRWKTKLTSHPLAFNIITTIIGVAGIAASVIIIAKQLR